MLNVVDNSTMRMELYRMRPKGHVSSCGDIRVTRLGDSRTTLFRVFKDEAGMSPKAYIDNARIDEAVRLLRETSLPAAEIGRRTGYRDPSYFGRVFRARYACPPSRFRRSGGRDECRVLHE